MPPARTNPIPRHLPLPVGLRLAGRRVVVIGRSEATARRVELLEGTGAEVVQLDPPLDPDACRGAALVLVCAGDEALAGSLDERARRGEFLLACVDSKHGTIEMPAVVRRGLLQVAVSTSGAAPALAARLRELLERLLPGSLAGHVDRLAAFRRSLAGAPPKQRHDEMKRAVEGIEIEGRLKLPG